MNNKFNKYELGFSAGTLLSEAFEAVLTQCSDLEELKAGTSSINYTIIPSNAESSKKRYFLEVMKRLNGMPVSVLKIYTTTDEANKRLIEFFAACKRYAIIAEFMIEVVRNKWLNLDFELERHDFRSFLLNKLADIEQLDQISEMTANKLTQVVLKMLKELGVFNGKVFAKAHFDLAVLNSIATSGNEWFLDVMLLTDDEKAEVYQW